jgi:hypothetical protein
LLLWADFFGNVRSGPNFRTAFFHGKSCLLNLTKMVWAIFWAIFSQTHLVTLNVKKVFESGDVTL